MNGVVLVKFIVVLNISDCIISVAIQSAEDLVPLSKMRVGAWCE
jgi:hypothetical protein